jgi:hypothetical protein
VIDHNASISVSRQARPPVEQVDLDIDLPFGLQPGPTVREQQPDSGPVIGPFKCSRTGSELDL